VVSYKTVLLCSFILYATGVLASFIEALAIRFVAKRAYDWRASLASYGMMAGRVVADFNTPIAIAMPGAFWLYQHRVADMSNLGAWSYLLLFFAFEFLYYWWHRVSHRSRWFWASHAAHHTANELNISASFRVGWTTRIMATHVMFVPLVLVGFDPRMVFAAYGVNLGYQAWLHTDWIPKLGFLEGILNTPSAHRVHHAANPPYLDANYGGVIMIYDRLLGTYVPEYDDLPVRYGLVEPIYSYNPFKLVFQPFVPIIRDLRTARSVREIAGYLFGPPEWRPDDKGTSHAKLRRTGSP
jgi:sterol desaturase/sphingolipid hydroxylase (fatty acid hydroxylase superfamily)